MKAVRTSWSPPSDAERAWHHGLQASETERVSRLGGSVPSEGSRYSSGGRTSSCGRGDLGRQLLLSDGRKRGGSVRSEGSRHSDGAWGRSGGSGAASIRWISGRVTGSVSGGSQQSGSYEEWSYRRSGKDEAQVSNIAD